jgi:hypothetical protein
MKDHSGKGAGPGGRPAISERDRAVTRARLEMYKKSDPLAERQALVEAWRKAHPEAAREKSGVLKPLMRDPTYQKRGPGKPDEAWFNDTYYVHLRRYEVDPVFGTSEGMIALGISSLDGSARHDWRDMQAIKNQLAGPECEGFELFPAESRLLDPNNHYIIWLFPGVKQIRVGETARKVRGAGEALAPQRALPDET